MSDSVGGHGQQNGTETRAPGLLDSEGTLTTFPSESVMKEQVANSLGVMRRMTWSDPVASETRRLMEDSVRLMEAGEISIEEAFVTTVRLMTHLVRSMADEITKAQGAREAVAA